MQLPAVPGVIDSLGFEHDMYWHGVSSVKRLFGTRIQTVTYSVISI